MNLNDIEFCVWISVTRQQQLFIALCNKSNGRCDIKAEKREELESKSSHKSDIWPPAASKKWGEIYWKYIFQTLEAIFPYKGVFFTKVVKANIIAFIKTKILRPVLSVTNPPFQKCQPLLHSALWICRVDICRDRHDRQSWNFLSHVIYAFFEYDGKTK